MSTVSCSPRGRMSSGRQCPVNGLAIFMGIAVALVSPAWAASRDDVVPRVFREDDAPPRALHRLVKGSHVKVFIPSLPYLYTSHSVNGALLKPSNNERGWEFDMATSYSKLDPKTYEFALRKGVRFQDGTPFNADSVVMNMDYFKKKPCLYSKIDKVFDHAEKVDEHTVRFLLKEEYGCFLNDVIWLQFYTAAYLEKFGWNGKANCPNLAEPGLYGLGPYILTEGYMEGDRQTARATLVANPLYWNKNQCPMVETVTVYTELDSLKAKNMTLYGEGTVDIAIIPSEDKVETILSPYGKLIISPSTDNIAIHMNLRNGNPNLLKREVRRALNEALNQKNLLHFVFEGEGDLSPISPLYPGVRELASTLRPFPETEDPYLPMTQKRLKSVLGGLELTVISQDRFLPLWKGIETQLKKVGVTLVFDMAPSEKEVFGTLLKTNARRNEKHWDLLVWGNDDWFFNHPWTAFFVYRTHNVWSTVYPDLTMDGFIEEMFRLTAGSPDFTRVCSKIMSRAYDNAYMLYVPTPNKVFAVNKEVVFRPYKMACFPLWNIQVTDQHWSVRSGAYPARLRQPVCVTRLGQK
jgi:ABC-type transport system substrate-binding protein